LIAEITDQNFETAVIGSKETFFLVFSSPWCAACKRIISFLDIVSQRHPTVGFGRIDISTNLVVPSEYNVLSIPSLVIYRGGKEVVRLDSQLDEEQINQAAAKYC